MEQTILLFKETNVNYDIEESIFETGIVVLEEQQLQNQEEMYLEKKTNDEEVFKDYIEIQAQIILSDEEIKAMWEEYKRYVDEIVFIELQDATLCR